MGVNHKQEQREIEFKLRVRDERSFEVIAEKIGSNLGPTVRQINYFFDTPDKDLDGAWYTLRLRDEGGCFKLTAKRPRGKASHGALRDRDEVEVELETSLAKKILAGREMPFTALKGLSEPSGFINAIESLIAGKSQELVGSFQNERSTMGPVKVDVGGESIELIFEMDRATFPGPQIHHEIEVEVCEDEKELAEKALRALWKKLDLEWIDDTPGKFKRFKDASKGKSIG